MMLRLTITKCQAFFVVYSVGSQKSLEVAKRQLEEIALVKGKRFPCVLVGNMKDLDSSGEREVSFEKGLKTAVEYGCAYIETSAMFGTDVKASFLSLVKKIEFNAEMKRKLFHEQHKSPVKEKSKSGVAKFLINLSRSSSVSSDDDED